MKKYLTVFSVSWSNGFVYRFNFILWRFRSVLLVLTVYFLWDAVFSGNGVILGYTRDKILTYVFLTLFLRSLILGQRSMDAAGEIADGRLSNYLLKPLNYHLYWLARDLADKLLNLFFTFFETIVLFLVLRPPIFVQSNPMIIFFFVLAILAAIALNFLLGNISSNFSFWTPGTAWGFWFIYIIFQEFLGGVMFPLDIFPKAVYGFLQLLPFPYLLFFPANVYLGKITGDGYLFGFGVVAFWIGLAVFILQREWRLGVKDYSAEGR